MNKTTTTTTTFGKLRNNVSACKSLIPDWYVVRLEWNYKDDGFVVAGLGGLLGGRNQRDIKNNDGGLRGPDCQIKRPGEWRIPLQFKSMIGDGK